MNKVESFSQELELILNPTIKEFATKAIQTLPDYLWEVGASSTGKYHPEYTLGKGGLIKHIRATIRILVELFRMEMFNYFSSEEKDLMIVALLLHDGAKSGIVQQRFTVFDHPLIIAEYIENHPDLQGILTKEQMDLMLGAVRSHMGAWNVDKNGQQILPKPNTKFQNMVHIADYIASRKMLEMNFDVPVSRE
jgi:hypothetical protein